MPDSDPVIRDLEIMSDARNYLSWIYRELGPHLGQRIIECGAGIGNLTERLISKRELVVAVDLHAPCLQAIRRRFPQAANLKTAEMDAGSPQILELAPYGPDTVVAVNVLEHIKDDRAALGHFAQLLPKGGRLLLLVPAMRLLYGSMDRRLGHYRRYSRKELADKVSEAGFSIRDQYFMNALAGFGWFLNNRVRHLTDQSSGQVRVFDSLIVPWMQQAERRLRPPFGMSLMLVGEKP